jgi:hypothetical protein
MPPHDAQRPSRRMLGNSLRWLRSAKMESVSVGSAAVESIASLAFPIRRAFPHALTVPMSHRPQPLHRAAGTIAIKPLVPNGFTVPLWSLSKPASGHCCGLPRTTSVATQHSALVSRTRCSASALRASGAPLSRDRSRLRPSSVLPRWLRSAKTTANLVSRPSARPRLGAHAKSRDPWRPATCRKEAMRCTRWAATIQPRRPSLRTLRNSCVGFVRPKRTPSPCCGGVDRDSAAGLHILGGAGQRDSGTKSRKSLFPLSFCCPASCPKAPEMSRVERAESGHLV